MPDRLLDGLAIYVSSELLLFIMEEMKKRPSTFKRERAFLY
jgi:hypothetical protein